MSNEHLVISLIIFTVFIFFFGAMLYLLIGSNFKTTNELEPTNTDTRTRSAFTCLPGQCATNIQSGFKTCPKNSNISMTIDPTQSVCNSRFLCDNPLTPFAVQSDGSTNINGICEVGIECPCLRYSQCPDYILSVFTVSNGNPYQSVSGQRILFPQQSSFVSANGIQTSVPPIKVDNVNTFCMASPAFLPLSSPGCNFINGADGNAMTLQQLQLCMGGQRGCSGINNNPCLQGVLAVITNNADNITPTTIFSHQFGCVAGTPCQCGEIAVYDTNFGNIVCKTIS